MESPSLFITVNRIEQYGRMVKEKLGKF